MALLLRDELTALLKNPQEPSVSIYSPMVEAGPDTRQNPVRIKNLLRQAEGKLVDLGMKPAEAREFLRPAADLLEDTPFWQQQNAGLALFRNPDLFRYYRLPLEFEDLTVVAGSFHVKPLLPLLTGDGRFYILAISENGARLYAATRYTLGEVPVEDMPKNLAEVLRFDQIDRTLQFHSHAGAGTAVIGRGLYHGHGEPKDLAKEHLERYFREIDRALQDVLRNEKAPLVLAGVRYFLPIYRTVNSYPHLLDEIVEGNPDAPRKEPNDLHRSAWKLVEPIFKTRQDESAELCRQAVAQGRGSNKLSEVVSAAHHARVDRLFVANGVQAWGSFSPALDSVRLNPSRTPEPGEEDLLNTAAFEAYLKGATVFAVNPSEMPVPGHVAAVYRF